MIFTCRLHSASAAGRKRPAPIWTFARLRDEALRPAYEGQPVQYRAYSCREGAYLPARELAAQPLVILEGSYSHHPLLTGCETLRVFLTCAKKSRPAACRRGRGAICKLCRPVGAAGGGLFCPVPHCGDGRFCGRHHPKRDDLKWLSRRRQDRAAI